ncbi:MAG TPA: hypothetical protein VH744_06375 [Terriglobales bacterium]|jgi:hypothetical protein
MAEHVKVTKTDDKNFNVSFQTPVKGPGGAKAGAEVPVEWLRAALDYYIANRSKSGAVRTKAKKIAQTHW